MIERTSARAEPGTLREYETVLILRPDLADDVVATTNEKIADIVDKHGGKLLKVEAWGRRRLAYRIAKHPKGLYYYWRFLANNPILSDMDHLFRMSENVLRQMTILVDENVYPDARPADVEPEALDPRLRAARVAEAEAAAAAEAEAAAAAEAEAAAKAEAESEAPAESEEPVAEQAPKETTEETD